MSDDVIPAPPQAFVPVAGGGKFPVRRIFCVGRNYADHAREMGHDPNREPPFLSLHPAAALVVGGAPTPYPPATSDLHHEIELVVALGQGGSNIAPADALSHVWGYAVGLDLTRRDLQDVARKAGRPWDMAKGFDASAPIGELVPAAGIDPTHGGIALMVNGTIRQQGDLAQMIRPVADAIA
jgi:fumarylpyruvate hydrolase